MSATEIATKAIVKAMDWNLRAYGKLACEEDAEFFAACVIRELEKEYTMIPKHLKKDKSTSLAKEK